MAEEIVRRKNEAQNPPPLPAVIQRQIQNMEGLLRRIRDIAEYVVKGRHSTDGWEVRYYTYHRVLSVVLAVLGAAGLVTLKVEAGQLQGAVSWAALVGGLAALLLNIALELYKTFHVEENALQALAAQQATSQLELNTKIGLRNPDPMPTLTSVLTEADGLARTFDRVMKTSPKPEVDSMVCEWADRYYGDWVLTDVLPQSKRPRE